MILLKNPRFNFRSTLGKGAATNAMLPIEKCLRLTAPQPREVARSWPQAGLNAAVLIWKASKFKYRFTLQAAPIR